MVASVAITLLVIARVLRHHARTDGGRTTPARSLEPIRAAAGRALRFLGAALLVVGWALPPPAVAPVVAAALLPAALWAWRGAGTRTNP